MSKISTLPNSTAPLNGSEFIPIVQSGQTRRMPVGSLSSVIAINAGTVQAALSADPNGAWNIIVPDTITVDYIELSDQNGFVIPENALARKGSTPYFGSIPINDSFTEYFYINNFKPTNSNSDTPLCSIDIPAGFFSPTSTLSINLDIELSLSITTSTPGPPAATAYDWIVGLVTGQELSGFISNPNARPCQYIIDAMTNTYANGNLLFKVSLMIIPQVNGPDYILNVLALGSNGYKIASDNSNTVNVLKINGGVDGFPNGANITDAENVLHVMLSYLGGQVDTNSTVSGTGKVIYSVREFKVVPPL